MNNILVVKIGGGAGLDMDAAVQDVARLAAHRPVIVVHGVSERMAQLSEARGMAVEMLQSPGGHSSRYTPPPVRDLFVEAAMQVNQEIIDGLQQSGISTHSVSNPAAIVGERKTAIRAVFNGRVRIVRDDHTGSITEVNAEALTSILQQNTVAVVPPLASSPDGLLNIDGDRAAAAISAALGAQELLILSNVRGVYRRYPDEASFVHQVPATQFEQALGWAEGRMKRKVLSAQTAIHAGVQRVIVADGRVQQPITQALQGKGTVFTA